MKHNKSSVIRVIFVTALFLGGLGLLAAQEFAGGSGTEADPWQIETAEHLNNVRNYLGRDHNDKFFIQTANIDLTEATREGGEFWNEGEGWIPIGDSKNHFRGHYNGNSMEINGLYINRPEKRYQGLFAYTYASTIKNLGVVNIDITADSRIGGLAGTSWYGSAINSCYVSGSVTGNYYIGGLVGNIMKSCITNSYYNYEQMLINGDNVITIGALYNEMFNIWFDNDLSLDIDEYLNLQGSNYLIDSVNDFRKLLAFGQFEQYSYRLTTNLDLADHPDFYIPYFKGDFYGDSFVIDNLSFDGDSFSYIGLFGYTESAYIENLGVTNVGIKGYLACGGLAGWTSNSTVSMSYSTGIAAGNIGVGGLIGISWDFSKIKDSYSTVNVTGEDWDVGGLIGRAQDFSTIRGCYSTGNVKAEEQNVGGLVGRIWDSTIIDSYSTGNVTGKLDVGGLVGAYDWSAEISNSYYNYEQVLINGENFITVGALGEDMFNTWLDNNLSLDIDEYLEFEGSRYLINSVTDLRTLLAFGQDENHSYRLTTNLNLADYPNLYIPYFRGNFDGQGFVIDNLTLTMDSFNNIGLFGLTISANISNLGVTNVDITGYLTAGGLAAWAAETNIRNSYSTGSVNGNRWVGGLTGVAWQSTNINNSYSTANVTGKSLSGGLVGYLFMSSILNCYSIGKVKSDSYTGGLVAYRKPFYSRITNSYWDTETSGIDTSDGGHRRTTAQMTYPYGENTFFDWDFDEVWKADENHSVNSGYPYLREDATVSVEEDIAAEIPFTPQLTNYPNPFNPETNIEFTIKEATEAALSIYNIKGQLVKTLHSGLIKAGRHKLIWDGNDNNGREVSSGVYFYRLTTDEHDTANKMLLVK